MLLSALYLVVLFGNSWIDYPAIHEWAGAAAYWIIGTLCAGASWNATTRRKVFLTAFLFVFLALPFVASLGLGFLRFAQMYSTGPEENEPIGRFGNAQPRPLVVHLSDTHFTEPGSKHTYDHDPWFEERVDQIAESVIRLRPVYLLHTGDVTDTGSDSQWKRAMRTLLMKARESGIRVIVAPGNHDLQPAFGGEPGPGSDQTAEAALTRRFLENLHALAPGLATVDHKSPSELLDWVPTADEVRKKQDTDFSNCMELQIPGPDGKFHGAGPGPGCAAAATAERARASLIRFHTLGGCPDWFPLAQFDIDTGTTIVVLCSVSNQSLSLGSNAIGALGDAQLDRLAQTLSQLPAQSTRVLVLLHHPPVRRWPDRLETPADWLSWTEWKNSQIFHYALLGQEVHNSRRLIDIVTKASSANPKVRITLFYGHRHGRALATINNRDWILTTSEAPAPHEKSGFGFRAGYADPSSGLLTWQWVVPGDGTPGSR